MENGRMLWFFEICLKSMNMSDWSVCTGHVREM